MRLSDSSPPPHARDPIHDSAQIALDGGSGRRGISRLIPFLGPAFVASVAYVDPGNFATNIESGSKMGYTLLWVILLSNLMAMLIQANSAKLGIATGLNLAEHCRERVPRLVAWGMWVVMEIVAMATDLAEFVGAALGFHLLLGLPLWIGGLLTVVATFLILGLERRGFRPMEAVIASMVGVVAGCYLVVLGIDLTLGKIDSQALLRGATVPGFGGGEGVLLAAGILGATVMPHAIFLHSSLTQGRVVVRDPVRLRRLFRFELVDVTVAMGVAGLVNAAMLIMAAATFHAAGHRDVSSIEVAHGALEPLLGQAAGIVFGLSLLASGLSSSAVGTMAGQVMMQGFIHHRIPAWLRRAATMAPSLLVILAGFDPTRTLVISQVILSFGLPFAIVPLVVFTSRRDVMGPLVNGTITTVGLWLVSGLVVGLNAYLILQLFSGR